MVGGSLKGPESVLNVKYQSFPVNYDTNLQILDTDYDNFAVIYSCTRIGPIGHTESAWVFTRERFAAGPVMQQAYGILDKYRISRTFFVKSEQKDCESLPPPVEADLTKGGEEKSMEKKESAPPVEADLTKAGEEKLIEKNESAPPKETVAEKTKE